MAVNDHNWILRGHRVTCAKGAGGQTIVSLLEAEELTEFHNADIARATKEINAIVDKIEKNNKDPGIDPVRFAESGHPACRTYCWPSREPDCVLAVLEWVQLSLKTCPDGLSTHHGRSNG